MATKILSTGAETKPAKFAARTDVTQDASLREMKKLLVSYGATNTMFVDTDHAIAIQFEMHGRRIRFILEMPQLEEFEKTPAGKPRTPEAQRSAAEQAGRQRWRAFVLVLKSKLVAIAEGVLVFEEEFFSHFVLPSGRTVFEEAAPRLAEIEAGHLPPMLPAYMGAKQ